MSRDQLDPPSSYADQIAQILEREILEGRYGRDEHLQQDELCRRFGVSRTPAREALRKLQAIGLVELIPNRGAMVRLPTLRELREVYRIRAELEGLATELTAANRTDELMARLHEAQHQLAAVVATVRPDQLREADGSLAAEQLRRFNDLFHQLIHTGSGNGTLGRMIQDLQRYFPKDAVRLAIASPAALNRLYLDEHAVILTELAAGHGGGARRAMQDHILRSQDMLLDYLRERGFGD
ncbi:MAG TPA: GntR family transcriptional regulator [Pseudonocardia sp.]|nr:GntR family transcriptional regulator [Pseudonocardia sp.]